MIWFCCGVAAGYCVPKIINFVIGFVIGRAYLNDE